MDYFKYVDYTCLKPNATIRDIEALCNEALKYHTASVCVNPYYVPLAAGLLKDSNVEVTAVVGFPLGANTTRVKALEAIEAIEDGATEIDLVININALKNGDYDYVKEEIEEIRDSINGKTLKVIVETCYLTEKELKKMVEICNETFVNFIKTSTGYGTRGVTIEDIDIINKYKEEFLEIKASGGIKELDLVDALLERGVTRLGMSNIDCLKGSKK
ncbi:MAG: deoxyribose-phosphate aldolase [Bacilli bacterium]|nr:deoxyribose-phosphate aldolase [Bacilli bacterium]